MSRDKKLVEENISAVNGPPFPVNPNSGRGWDEGRAPVLPGPRRSFELKRFSRSTPGAEVMVPEMRA
jgi:hypothetical protein